MKLETASLIALIWWFLSGHGIIIWKWSSIWKGICGGNGIPQGNELGRALALYTLFWEFGLTLFIIGHDADLEFLILLFGVIGLTTYSDIQLRKNKNKSNEST